MDYIRAHRALEHWGLEKGSNGGANAVYFSTFLSYLLSTSPISNAPRRKAPSRPPTWHDATFVIWIFARGEP